MGLRRVGILGGSFNPVHLGHLAAARAAREVLRLDEVWFLPCGRSPDKKKLMPAALRLRALRAALRGHPGYRVETLEIKRRGISRTVDSLDRLVQDHPSASFTFLMGADQAQRFGRWKNPQGIVALAELAVLSRPGYLPKKNILARWNISPVKIPQYEISSTEIRRRLARKEDISWMVPQSVARILSRP